MGYMSHNAIVCVFFSRDRAELCHAKAKEIFGENVSEITKEVTNGYCSFLVPPDGSKEGWSESYNGDMRRDEFKKWLTETKEQHWCDWVEISMPEDDAPSIVSSYRGA